MAIHLPAGLWSARFQKVSIEIFRKIQRIPREEIFKLFGLFNLGEAEKLDRRVNYTAGTF